MKIEEIITFIKTQDIYYFGENFRKSDKRDPEIFKYIIITDEDKNYSNNLKLIEKEKIMGYFFGLNDKMQDKFYSILLNQMKKIQDFGSIFYLIQKELFSRQFTIKINEKISELKYFALDEKKNEKIIFSIFDNLLIINNYNSMDLNYIINQIEINYDLPVKYYLELLDNQKMADILVIIKGRISDFFIRQYNDRKLTGEAIISMLLISKERRIISYFLDELDKNILTIDDFYNKEITLNYQLFKLFFERCSKLLNNKDIYNGQYLIKSVEIKSKIEQDLINCTIEYEKLKLLITSKNKEDFFKRIRVIIEKENEAIKVINNLETNLQKCRNKFKLFTKMDEFYSTFYKVSKKNIIEKISQKIKHFRKKTINEILQIENFLSDEKDFNFEKAKEDSKKIEYKNSCFFMAIYSKKEESEKNEGKSEEDIFKETIADFKRTLEKIINQKQTKEPFFKIENVEEILNQIKNPKNNLKKEIEILKEEFKYLNKENYIKNNLLTDLHNFSNKYKIIKLIKGIISFIQTFNNLHEIKISDFSYKLKETLEMISSNEVNSEEIEKASDILKQYNLDIKTENSLTIFYELILDKEESINFIKILKESNYEIRNLNDFIDDSASELQTSNIEDLLYVYSFYNKLLGNKNIITDINLIEIFNREYSKDKNIAIHMQDYLKTFGEIIQLYKSYDENPESTLETIENLLKESSLELFMDTSSNSFTFKIDNKNVKDLEELRNKILMTNSDKAKNDNDNKIIQKEKGKDKDKAQIINEYINLLDNINQFNKTLNNLVKSGYPGLRKISLQIKDSLAKDENNKNLDKIIEEFMEINKKFQKSIKEGYEKYPLLRLLYGEQFIKLYEQIKEEKDMNINILHLINSISLNMINDSKIDFMYQKDLNVLENINNYLMKLFEKNNVSLEEIYQKNSIMETFDLEPGLYRKVKFGGNNDLVNNIINIYLNITNNLPIINTLLICNEETSIQKIKSFLYRALFCNDPVLFLISNMELLDLSTTKKLIKTLKYIIKTMKSKNKKINSLILFMYEKKDSGLVRDLEKLIPERNILNDIFLKKPEKNLNAFNKTILYCSKYSGYGKTTQIKYDVKNKGDNSQYFYLPLGGSFNRKYVLENLLNLNLDLTSGNSTYLHLDLSDTDNDDLMNEILFKLIILRYLESNDKLYYLGYDINIIIEIPNGFYEFEKKFKILDSFKKVYIEKLPPLRLEEEVTFLKDSPISIVAEVLTLYDDKRIQTVNLNLNKKIKMSAEECEKIINKYFTVENQNYYQKMNFIKILSVQFKKFCENIYFFYDNTSLIKEVLQNARYSIISNFIKLTKIFTSSPFDSILLLQNKSMEIMGEFNEIQAIEEGVMALANEKKKKEIFSFKKINPSLVFFNRDGLTYSIISNNDKTSENYKNLKLLWNSQNIELFKIAQKEKKKINDIISYQNLEHLDDLIDYKNMEHINFLTEIKKIFSLESMKDGELKKICEDLGNYIFVSDNFIKMVRILLNIEAKIPVILMGETGVGKTKLLEMLVRLYGKGKANWKKLEMHAGITDKDIINFIQEVEKEYEKEEKKDELIWIFFDEINTCNSLGLITEIMCNHTYLGKKINDNFIFLGACNPYRVLTKKMREGGLVYYNIKEKNKLNTLFTR